MLVFQGKEAGQNFISLLITRELEARRPGPWCFNVHANNSEICRDAFGMATYESMRAVCGLTAGRESDPLYLLQCIIELQTMTTGTAPSEKLPAQGCEMCRADLRAAIQRARQTIWDNIPGWFGINVMMLEDL
jgi:hypothetical protein